MKGPDGYSEEDWLALSGIQHFSFCKRQWALIHIEQLWSENYLTTAGHLEHERAHDYAASESRGDMLIMRDLRVYSRALGITGACDVVEDLRNMVEADFLQMHDLFSRGWTPKVKQTRSCSACSLRDLCLPELRKMKSAKAYIEERLKESGE